MAGTFLALIGLELTPNNHREKIISGLGGFVGIAVLAALTTWMVGPTVAVPVVASMGASAVLLFAAPHGPLSQPWPFAIGHLISAAIGVCCARWIPDSMLAGAAAVGLAITAMYYTRSIHPPGGATALTAVLGGAAVKNLGFEYVLLPVGANVVVLLAMAVAFNGLFPWRRYPASLVRHTALKGQPLREDWAFALAQIESLADVSEDELVELHTFAVQHADMRRSSRRPATTVARGK